MRVERRTAKKGYVCIDCKKKIKAGAEYFHFVRDGKINQTHLDHGDPQPPPGGEIKWISRNGKVTVTATKKKVGKKTTKKKAAKNGGKK